MERVRDLGAMSDDDIREEVEAEVELQEASALHASLWEECKLFDQDAFGSFMTRIAETRERLYQALASPNVPVDRVPTIRGQISALDAVVKLPEMLRQQRDRIGAQIAQAMVDPDTEEEIEDVYGP